MSFDETHAIKTAYRYWAPVYDLLCGKIFAEARAAAVESSEAIGPHILEIGVGTGLSWQYYRRPDVDLVGIDLSEEMLRKAQHRRTKNNHRFVRSLIRADAHRLPFPDAAFDCVLAQFMITLVAKPKHILDECARVTRRGGAIVIVSHFGSERSPSLFSSKWIETGARSLGLRPGFAIERLFRWAKGTRDVTPFTHSRVDRMGFYHLLIARRI